MGRHGAPGRGFPPWTVALRAPHPGIMPCPAVRCCLAVSLLLACGDDGPRETGSATGLTGITSATTPGSASDPTAPTTGGSATNGTTDATGATGTTGAPGMSATTDGTATDPLTGDGPASGPGETGVGTTDFDPPPTGEYAAQHVPGEQNRVIVRKASVEGDWCATVTFVSPQDMGPLEFDVALPATWRVQSALIHKGAADCLAFAGFPDEPIMAVSGNGEASWAGACPGTLAIDLTLAFPPEQPWVPPAALLQARAVAVAGC